MNETQVAAENLRKEYQGEFVAVEKSSFEVQQGEVLGVVGPNGAGKTTTLKMVSGLIEPSAGSATISGIDSTTAEMHENLGFLPEESPSYDAMTARSYLNFFADLYSVPDSVAADRIDKTLTELDLEYRDRPIGNLSKGMTRKVLIARALINDPSVLVFDEPASGLDPYTTNYIIEYIAELADRGKSIVFSAHNLYHVESLCDRVLIMNNGVVQARGTVEEIRREHGDTNYDVILDEKVGDSVEHDGRHKKRVSSVEAVETVKEQARQNDIGVVDVYTVEPSLEEIFLDLIGDPDEN